MKVSSQLSFSLSGSVSPSGALTPVFQEDGRFQCWYWGKKFHSLPFDLATAGPDLKSVLPSINDHFILILRDKQTRSCQIANDRFAAFPLYYAQQAENLFFSDTFFHLFKHSEKLINLPAILQFMHFQRLFGEATFIQDIRFLESASLLTWSPGDDCPTVEKYWWPSFKKKKQDLATTAREFNRALRRAVPEFEAEPVILLSGGLDSRVALASTPVTRALTLGETKGLEFKVAEKLATLKGVPITFVQREDELYFDLKEVSASLGGGMLNIMHSHFFSAGPFIKTGSRIFHGHGFDYLFQGMYLPQTKKKVLNRKTLHSELKRPKDIVRSYASEVKFRMKSVPLAALVNPGIEVEEALHAPLMRMQESFKARVTHDDELDLWEFFTIDNLSRHYTGLNLRSMELSASQTTLSWDNDILDIFLSLPYEHKLNARLLKKALLLLHPGMAKATNANVNMPAHWDSKLLSIAHFGSLFLNKLGFKRFGPPPKEERSWPDMNEVLRLPSWVSYLEKLAIQGKWRRLGLFDEAKVKQLIESHVRRQTQAYDFIFSLVTVELFLDELWA